MSTNSSNKNTGCISLLVLILLAAIIYSGYRFFADMSLNKSATTAFNANDLETAYQKYDDILDSFHLLDLGGYKKKADAGLLACAAKEFQQATLFYDAGDFKQAYKQLQNIQNKKYLDYDLGDYYNDSTDLQKRALDSLKQYMNMDYEAGNCDVVLADIEWIEANAGSIKEQVDITEFTQNKGICEEFQLKVADVNGSPTAKAKSMAEFILANEGEQLAGLTGQKLKNLAIQNGIANIVSADVCTVLLMEWIGDGYEEYLFNCGLAYETEGMADSAIDMFNQFVEKYPDDSRYQFVVDTLADLLISNARAQGAGSLPAPDVAGKTKKGTSQYIVTNDTPYPLRFVFSGPEKKIVTIVACPTCIEYAIAPFSCPTEGPEETITLLPGEYSLLVETATSEGVTPYTGTFTMDDGTKYESCFYIVTR